MAEHQSTRTLVKSAPELWAECSDAASLARHLGACGEIRITRLEPETTVAWEGAAACGTVRLEPSGWGTKVTLTISEDESAHEPAVAPAEPEPAVAVAEPAAAGVEPPPAGLIPRRPGILARLLRRRRPADVATDAEPSVDAVPPAEQVASEPLPVAQPPDLAPIGGEDTLVAALDSLGRAHHRPYSRG